MYDHRDHPAIARILYSNSQWAHDVEQAQPGFFKTLAKGQSPQVLWIGCSDSRVPETVLLGAKPGDIFVTRNIANQFHLDDDSVNSVLTFALMELGVQHVVIVGHTKCGGAAAGWDVATGVSPGPPSTTPLGKWLGGIVDLATSLKDKIGSKPKDEALLTLVEENVKKQVGNLKKSNTIQEAWKTGKDVHIHGWVFELETGRLRDLGVSTGPPSN